jgi:hypothetical protein
MADDEKPDELKNIAGSIVGILLFLGFIIVLVGGMYVCVRRSCCGERQTDDCVGECAGDNHLAERIDKHFESYRKNVVRVV